jgi:malonyl-CoA/methylmalonyl-CoA synthetase
MLGRMSAATAATMFSRAESNAERTAVVEAGRSYSYQELLQASATAASGLLAGAHDLGGARVCFLIAPGFDHVAIQWAVLRAGGVAVPLCASHPAPELAHVIDDARASIVVTDQAHAPSVAALAQARGLRHVLTETLHDAQLAPLPTIDGTRHAMLIYTSGTTGKPKGAISTHAILEAQMRAIVTAWELAPTDRILHVLPLHHLHGVLNALCAPLYAGACVEFMPRFDAPAVLVRLASEPAVSVFMAVPTIYTKLLAEWDTLSGAEQSSVGVALRRMRLIVSGSAALPVSLLERFRRASGHILLERYGMTELGMALGNPLRGERRAGSVGVPFPDVTARIVDEAGRPVAEGAAGELQIRGPNVFAGYWDNPEATRHSFADDGFFRTGDVAVCEGGYYRLLGRESVDIIKTGGFKVSALEIEEMLREHPAVAEAAVIGVADVEWGERVAAVVVLQPSASVTLDELRAFGKQRLASYKVPTLLCCMTDLPRNAMGKVQKPGLRALFASGADPSA